MPPHPRLRRIPATAFPAALLVLMAVLSAALAWQVTRAARSQEGSTRRLLAATVAVGARELGREVEDGAQRWPAGAARFPAATREWIVDSIVVASMGVVRLPEELVGAARPQDVLAVRVTDGVRILYGTPEGEDALRRGRRPVLDERVDVRDSLPTLPRVSQRLGGVLEGLTMTVSVRPEAAAWIARDAAPAVPLPLLLAAFLVNLALFAVAVAQLRRQHELVRLRGEFVAGVSHELRTPLAQIRLFAELLASGRLNDEQQRRSVGVIHNDARRLTLLVENVLRFARAGRGDRVSPVETAVAPLLADAAASAAALWPRARVESRADDGLAARVDPGALRQIVLNLLENAAKYGPAGQTVTVAAARGEGGLRVWVDDEGPGIPPADRPRVWEPYFRLERDAASPAGGTGIGLSVVRELAALHGGRAWVTSSPAGGARFVVHLPDAGDAAGETDDGAASPHVSDEGAETWTEREERAPR